MYLEHPEVSALIPLERIVIEGWPSGVHGIQIVGDISVRVRDAQEHVVDGAAEGGARVLEVVEELDGLLEADAVEGLSHQVGQTLLVHHVILEAQRRGNDLVEENTAGGGVLFNQIIPAALR